jgi:hypothetical protein
LLPDKASVLKGLDLVARANSGIVRFESTINAGLLIFQCVAGRQQVFKLRLGPLAREVQQDQCARQFRLIAITRDKKIWLILASFGGH